MTFVNFWVNWFMGQSQLGCNFSAQKTKTSFIKPKSFTSKTSIPYIFAMSKAFWIFFETLSKSLQYSSVSGICTPISSVKDFICKAEYAFNPSAIFCASIAFTSGKYFSCSRQFNSFNSAFFAENSFDDFLRRRLAALLLGLCGWVHYEHECSCHETSLSHWRRTN